jgi:hypothetical protein
MRILLEKLTDERHRLVIERAPEAREAVECETRSILVHDLLHYAVESEARVTTGFWGNLAAGKTLADMNDRSGASMKDAAPEMAAIEQLVGALHGSTKGIAAGELVAGIRRFAASLGATTPDWLTEPFVIAVQERMRRLQGHWRATPFGGVMELPWPA